MITVSYLNGRLFFMYFLKQINRLHFSFFLAALLGAPATQSLKKGLPFLSTPLTISDVSKTGNYPIAKLYKPESVEELQNIVKNSLLPISVAGGRFSQGGHIACKYGNVVDITGLDAVKKLNFIAQEITVETGITWRAIQDYIAPYNLSVKVMQSYNDFTVGGSLSVNVHGRDIHYGPLIETVKEIEILLADGTLVKASRTQNSDLFAAAIGGYGAVGIITQATLSLTSNSRITQTIKRMPVEDYTHYFLEHIRNNPQAVLHNANLYPNDFKTVGSITWYHTDQATTINEQLQEDKNFFPKQMIAEQMLRRVPLFKKIRPWIELKKMTDPLVVNRNYEMSSTVKSLEPLVRFPTTTVLQEYFIPINSLMPFIEKLRLLVQEYDINILNISIRYIPQNTESILSYARNECFSLVFYINFLNTKSGLEYAQKWTRELIDCALSLAGTYYLPYQLFGTVEQVRKAYPRLDEFIEIKKKYDPNHRFCNVFLKKYSI